MAFIHERNDVEKHRVSAEPAFFLRKRWAKEQGNTNLNLDLLRIWQFNQLLSPNNRYTQK